MRKWQLVVVLVVVFVIAIGLAFYFFKEKPGTAMEDVLPSGPMMYVHVVGLDNTMQRMEKTSFWQRLQEIDIDLLIKKSFSEVKGQEILQWKENFLSPENQALLKMILGKEFALAIYPFDIPVEEMSSDSESGWGRVIDQMIGNTYLVVRMNLTPEVLESIVDVWKKKNQGLEVTSTEYRDHKIWTLHLPQTKTEISFVGIQDLILMTFALETAQKSIDTFEGEADADALSDDEVYDLTSERIPSEPDVFAYFNVEQIDTAIQKGTDIFLTEAKEKIAAGNSSSWTEESVAQLEKRMEEIRGRVGGFRIFVLSSVWDDLLETDFNLFFNPDKMEGAFRQAYTCLPGENTTLNFTPKDTILYQWSNCWDVPTFWRQMRPAGTPPLPSVMDASGAPIDIEQDVIASIGGEMGWYVQDVSMKTAIPVPNMVLFFQTKATDKIDGFLQQLMNQLGADVSATSYEGTMIRSLTIPSVENFKPSYCFLNRFLLIGTTPETLQGAVDVSKKKSVSLAASKPFQSVNQGLTQPSRGIQFVDFSSMAGTLKKLVTVGDALVSQREASLTAFVDGARARLNDVQAKIVEMETEVKNMEKQRDGLQAPIENGQTSDAGLASTKVTELNAQIEAVRKDLQTVYDQKKEVEATMQNYQRNVPDPSLRQMWVKSFFLPLCDALQEISGFGSRTTVDVDKNVFETKMWVNLGK